MGDIAPNQNDCPVALQSDMILDFNLDRTRASVEDTMPETFSLLRFTIVACPRLIGGGFKLLTS